MTLSETGRPLFLVIALYIRFSLNMKIYPYTYARTTDPHRDTDAHNMDYKLATQLGISVSCFILKFGSLIYPQDCINEKKILKHFLEPYSKVFSIIFLSSSKICLFFPPGETKNWRKTSETFFFWLRCLVWTWMSC